MSEESGPENDVAERKDSPCKHDVHDAALQLEKCHVHDVYERIAEHFSDTRHKPWPRVASFVLSLGPGTLLLDVGCGNGKYLNLADSAGVSRVGCDRSPRLLSICRSNGHQVVQCDAINLPFASGTFDACISIAVIHHMANEDRRLEALREMVRVLRPAGRALVYVWALEQDGSKYLKDGRKEAKVNRRGEQQLAVHVNRTRFQQQDVLVPWHKKSKSDSDQVFHRFYHVFRERELEELCSNLHDVQVLESYHDNGNWCVLFAKR